MRNFVTINRPSTSPRPYIEKELKTTRKPQFTYRRTTKSAQSFSAKQNFSTRYVLGNLEYRAEKKSWYVVARNFFLLLINFSAWPAWVLLSKICKDFFSALYSTKT